MLALRCCTEFEEKGGWMPTTPFDILIMKAGTKKSTVSLIILGGERVAKLAPPAAVALLECDLHLGAQDLDTAALWHNSARQLNVEVEGVNEVEDDGQLQPRCRDLELALLRVHLLRVNRHGNRGPLLEKVVSAESLLLLCGVVNERARATRAPREGEEFTEICCLLLLAARPVLVPFVKYGSPRMVQALLAEAPLVRIHLGA
mmetsp:Transcript_59376/g.145809  ORF Transcript_59376/g.145809 Transcript_59376/m.145809 type:complete len:203 (+) Transcript_59376:1958-2566(+)